MFYFLANTDCSLLPTWVHRGIFICKHCLTICQNLKHNVKIVLLARTLHIEKKWVYMKCTVHYLFVQPTSTSTLRLPSRNKSGFLSSNFFLFVISENYSEYKNYMYAFDKTNEDLFLTFRLLPRDFWRKPDYP